MSDALLRIVGSRGKTIAAVLERAPGPAPRHLVVVAPAFGFTIRRSLLVARYLLAHGFDVLRYDATDHVGRSDGAIADFTLGAALADVLDVVRFARAVLAPSGVSLVATSLGGRVALRASGILAREGADVASIASIACVVDVRETIAAATGTRWLDGDACVTQTSATVLEHEIRASFARDAKEGGWSSLEGTLADVAAGRAPILDVHGESDPWVARADVLRVAEHPRFELALLGAAVHELNPVSGKIALGLVTRHLLAHASGADVPLDAIAAPSWAEVVRQNKRERAWEISPIEEWVLSKTGA